jgi:hypothetical protein
MPSGEAVHETSALRPPEGADRERLVVDAHGGRIAVEDVPGWSTSFVVRLPARASMRPPVSRRSGSPASGFGGRSDASVGPGSV